VHPSTLIIFYFHGKDHIVIEDSTGSGDYSVQEDDKINGINVKEAEHNSLPKDLLYPHLRRHLGLPIYHSQQISPILALSASQFHSKLKTHLTSSSNHSRLSLLAPLHRGKAEAEAYGSRPNVRGQGKAVRKQCNIDEIMWQKTDNK